MKKTRVAKIADLLNRHGVDYIIVGAEACNFHGVIRSTKDVDVLIRKDLKNAEKALNALSELPYRLAEEILPEEVLKKPVTIIGDDPRVDLLLAAGNTNYDKAIGDAHEVILEGVKITCAGLKTLIESKKTDRAKDAADLEVLLQVQKNLKT